MTVETADGRRQTADGAADRELTYLQAISEALREEMRRDETVFCLGEDIGAFGGAFKVTDGFIEEFGADRVLDAPLAESAIIGAAIGAALVGMRPICEMQFVDFLMVALDQLLHQAALAQPMPDGATAHEGVFAEQWEPLGDGQAPWSHWAREASHA